MVTKKSREKKEKKERKAKDPMKKAQGTVAKPRLKRSMPTRSGDAIKVPKIGYTIGMLSRQQPHKSDTQGYD